MSIFVFIRNGVPGYRSTLESAQAAVEDHYIDGGFDSLQWGENGSDRFGAYLWGFGYGEMDSSRPAPFKEDLIWEWTGVTTGVDKAPEALSPLFPGGAELSLTVKTTEGKAEFVRRVTEEQWAEKLVRPHALLHFATNAGASLAEHFSKEGN